MEENVNMLDKDKFIKKYQLTDCFSRSGLIWENLQKIYDDYIKKFNDIENCCNKFETFCRENFTLDHVVYHSIRCRPKDPEHLIEKIIRKRGKEQSAKYKGINVENYKDIIQDLIGLRILVIKKEDWEIIFDELIKIFPSNPHTDCYMVGDPEAYIQYGDRDIYKGKIKKEYSNKGYRSQHYIIKFGSYYCEIQVRTLAEEVYGEFDHLVKYPYRNDNNFLIRYTNILSKLINSIDEIMSTCFQMDELGWNQNADFFEKDKYDDWTTTSQFVIPKSTSEESRSVPKANSKTPINIRNRANDILLRKENN